MSELRIDETVQINASTQTNLAANVGSHCHQIRVSEENCQFRPQTVSCRPEPMKTDGRTSRVLAASTKSSTIRKVYLAIFNGIGVTICVRPSCAFRCDVPKT